MELGIDLMEQLRERVAGGLGDASPARPDWPALHARFAAGHAARAELAHLLPAGGSFAERISFPRVNPTDSTNHKSPFGIEGTVAGTDKAGGRG